MDDLFDILDSKEAPKSEVVVPTTTVPKADAGKSKINLWEDEIEALEIDKDSLLKFNRMFTIMSHGEVPGETIILMEQISKLLHSKGFTFRFDGSAQDTAASIGYSTCKDRSEIYLPWKGFNKDVTGKLVRPSEKAYRIAAGINPRFNNIPPTVRAMVARVVHVIMGDECNTPVNLCIIYTADGAETKADLKAARTGNVPFTIYLCEALGIPVFNLKNATAKERIAEFLNTMIKEN